MDNPLELSVTLATYRHDYAVESGPWATAREISQVIVRVSGAFSGKGTFRGISLERTMSVPCGLIFNKGTFSAKRSIFPPKYHCPSFVLTPAFKVP